MDEMIACCGLNCSSCPGFRATQNDDEELRQQTAAQWSKIFDRKIEPSQVRCHGCLTQGGVHFGHCHTCPVRICCLDRDLPNCAFCPDYPCSNLDFIHRAAPAARACLDKIHSQTKD